MADDLNLKTVTFGILTRALDNVKSFLDKKAEKEHEHNANDITETKTRKFTTNAEKALIDKIITTGDGNKALFDDGEYYKIEAGKGSVSNWGDLENKPFDGIDDNTLKVNKLTGLLSVKRKVLTRLQFDLLRADDLIDEDMIYIITDDNNSSEENIPSPSGLIQKTFINKVANESFYINIDKLSLDKAVIQLYKFIPGEENIVQTIKTFDNSESDSFFYNNDCIEFSKLMKIKDAYELDFDINTDGIYETDIIDKSNFVDLYSMEVI